MLARLRSRVACVSGGRRGEKEEGKGQKEHARFFPFSLSFNPSTPAMQARSRIALQTPWFCHPNNPVLFPCANFLCVSFQDVVQSLIAELLNSNSWKDRATACKVIPKLKGGANKVRLMACFLFSQVSEIHYNSPFVPSSVVGSKKLES